MAGLLVLCILATCNRNASEFAVNGRIEVDDVHIGSKIGGRVSKVCCEEGDQVAAGSAVVMLETQELEAQLEEARAAAAQAQAQLDLLLAGTREEDLQRAEAQVAARQAELDLRVQGYREEDIKEAEANLAAAQSRFTLAKTEYERARELLAAEVLQQQDLDAKHNALLNAEAAVEVAHQTLARLRSGFRPQEIAAARAQLAQAEAELARLRHGARAEELAAARAAVAARNANIARLTTQLEETRLVAPMAGVIETLDLQPGDLVRAGETVAVLLLPNQPWVRCYVPENRLGLVHPADAVTVVCDTFPDRRFAGVVRRMNAEAEYTPRNVQTQETRSELVFEMKVDITEPAPELRAGMYADVYIPLRNE